MPYYIVHDLTTLPVSWYSIYIYIVCGQHLVTCSHRPCGPAVQTRPRTLQAPPLPPPPEPGH